MPYPEPGSKPFDLAYRFKPQNDQTRQPKPSHLTATEEHASQPRCSFKVGDLVYIGREICFFRNGDGSNAYEPPSHRITKIIGNPTDEDCKYKLECQHSGLEQPVLFGGQELGLKQQVDQETDAMERNR